MGHPLIIFIQKNPSQVANNSTVIHENKNLEILNSSNLNTNQYLAPMESEMPHLEKDSPVFDEDSVHNRKRKSREFVTSSM